MWNIYPYKNLTDLNLDFILRAIGEMENQVKNFVAINAIKYANPIQWDITRSYEKNTVVIDGNSGVAYISVAPVPYGVALTRPEYWTVVFDLSMFITKGAANFANNYEVNPTTTATMDTNEGDWVVWDSTLFEALTNIHAGDTYVINGNIKKMTVEDFYNTLFAAIAQEVQDRQDEDNRIELSLTNLINSQVGIEAGIRASEDSRIELSLTNLVNSRVNAVMASVVALDGKVGNLANLTTSDKTSIVNAINEVNSNVKFISNRSGVASCNVNVGGYIVATNCYQNDGIIAMYEVTNDYPDGYLNIAMSNGNTASLIYDKVIHAHQVGAYPDNNDCTGAINAIINNVSGATIKFGVGRYTFDDRIWLNDNQTIEGCGSDTILYCSQDPAGNHGEFIGIIGENGVVKDNITLRDFDIDIYYLPSSTEDVNAIGCVSAKNILIERVNVLRSNWRGFQFEGEANGKLENVIVRDCKISNTYLNGVGLSHGAGGSLVNILFENVIVENSNQNAGFWVQGAGANDINMANITFRNIAYYGGTVRAMYLINSKNIIVDGFTASDIDDSLYGIIQAQSGGNIRFNDITVYCKATNANNWAIMLYEVLNCKIDGLITSNATIGIQIQNDCDRVIAANSIINVKTGGTPIRNQVANLRGYIAACSYNGAVSNASVNFIELT